MNLTTSITHKVAALLIKQMGYGLGTAAVCIAWVLSERRLITDEEVSPVIFCVNTDEPQH